jgi:hypothetical protein
MRGNLKLPRTMRAELVLELFRMAIGLQAGGIAHGAPGTPNVAVNRTKTYDSFDRYTLDPRSSNSSTGAKSSMPWRVMGSRTIWMWERPRAP